MVVVEGVVRSRPVESVNKKMVTGSIEVMLVGLHFLFFLLLSLDILIGNLAAPRFICFLWNIDCVRQVVAEHAQLLNAVKTKLPFLVTTVEDAKDSVKEEIRLRYISVHCIYAPHLFIFLGVLLIKGS